MRQNQDYRPNAEHTRLLRDKAVTLPNERQRNNEKQQRNNEMQQRNREKGHSEKKVATSFITAPDSPRLNPFFRDVVCLRDPQVQSWANAFPQVFFNGRHNSGPGDPETRSGIAISRI